MGERYVEKIRAAAAVLIFAMGMVSGSMGAVMLEPYIDIVETDYDSAVLMSLIAVALVLLAYGMLLMVIERRAIIKREVESYREENHTMKQRVSELKFQIRQLQNAYSLKERASKAKSKFLNRMSHDLRTPMNAIMGYSMLLQQSADCPDKVGHYARKINLSGQTLLELINDVLDMSCIESGNVKLVKHQFSIMEALDEVKAAIRPQIEARKQKFGFYITNRPEQDMITGDRQRICQILRNLLSNATKYTPDGGSVDMFVNFLETGNNEIRMLCQIKDTGCGMSEEFMQKIFRPFEREDNQLNDKNQGTGLGMSIAKSFLELMDGSIAVESKVNEGTLVTVQLPLIPAEVRTHNIFDIAEADYQIVKGLRFLAAEDNESNAEILKELLSFMGAECVIAGDGQAVAEIFEASAENEFDMILMDIQMPIMNGYQAATAIRKCGHPRAGDITIIAMTADAFEEDVQKAFVSGMNAHVAKPLELQSFINTIKSLKKN